MQFKTLMHCVYHPEMLRESYHRLKRDAAPGVDGITWKQYGQDLDSKLTDLSERLKRGAYRVKPSRRVYIAKEDGRQRPLGIASLEDKLVQRAAVTVMNAIYEQDFLGFSYGFRPGRSQHNALDALDVGLRARKMNWVLDLDISGFFDAISREWLVKFIRHRIADERVVRLIQKWLNAGVFEDGIRRWQETGTPQGGSASPLLANVYLHYVFDLWAHRWRKRQARGDVILVRYADDIIAGFQHREEAERFLSELRDRLAKFGLELHPTKTRLIRFGRYAASDREKRGEGRPETFNFLGFTHMCGTTKNGGFTVCRQTMRKRLQGKINEVKAQLISRMHDPVPEVGKWLASVVRGHVQYYGVPGNSQAIGLFRFRVARLWQGVLSRRSQNGRVDWARMARLIRRWLPPATICHPYPSERLCVTT